MTMVPEEADHLGEKFNKLTFDKLGRDEIRCPRRHPYMRLKTI